MPQAPKIEVIDGQTLLLNEVPDRRSKTSPVLATLPLVGLRKPLYITDDVFSEGILVLGRPGTGKSNLISFLLDGIEKSMTDRDIAVVFDPKEDYWRRHGRSGDVVIRANSGADEDGAWSLPAELNSLGDPEEEREIILNDICHLLIGDTMSHSSSNSFFEKAARDMLGGVVSHLARQPEATNASLRNYFDSSNASSIRKLVEGSEKTRWLADYLPERVEGQTGGVIATLKQAVNDVFQGRFSAPGDISIRKEIRRKGGRFVFLAFRVSSGKTIAPGFATILNLAIREALVVGQEELDREGQVASRVYFVVDEFARLPRVTHLEPAINFGRGLGLRFALGLQSWKQALAAFPDEGETILSGLGTMFAHHVADEATREEIKGRAGKNLKRVAVRSTSLANDPEAIFPDDVIQDKDVASLERGQTIVVMPAIQPFKVTLQRYEDWLRATKGSGRDAACVARIWR